ncbi:putative helicase [Paraburkholderia sp. WC7.3g]|uniref:type ISP restriction/modification enzyme n=1 Tax=Paraburkholderia sp. WC7.3g TaxID=2991070 RepID=UPI003D235FEE
MSQILITHYLAELDRLKKVGGTHRETVVREAFKDLLKRWGKQLDLVFIPEYKIDSLTKEVRFVDGALLHELRVPFGYWEAKDSKDDLDAEIALKFKRGYPQDNIIFEDSTRAVLIQNRKEVMRCDVDNVQDLEKLLKLFFSYQRPEIDNFRRAVKQFKSDLPAVLQALRDMIDSQYTKNAAFRSASASFLKHAQEAINPNLTEADVREMLIQHILTEEIFSKVFDSDFHRDNNVARKLYKLEETFFTGGLKKKTLRGLDAYYAAIRAAAAQINSHHEKQNFLKVIYENFYKEYNKKAADRLGVVYTPNEIVRFMIEGTDWLCEKYFDRHLIDKNVEILDPATGTGTFVCELLEYFRGQPSKLRHKYKEELHANEVAILPYYVANLNIEATYASITDEYEEFQNLCFVDTLDNVGLHTAAHGTTADLFGSVSEENVERIKRQNSRKISVIIGNPPYNANQANENHKNKNREYPEIDSRIKKSYIFESTAQKTKLYDMYARFFRWASDRLDHNGILAFVTNRSFIDSRTFDGFRKVISKEFSVAHVVDLGGDVRSNSKLSGTKHNVFGIQTGVAISFFVKRQQDGKKASKSDCRIFYFRRPEFETAEEKLAFINNARISSIEFDEIKPDENNNWISEAYSDSMLVLGDKNVKSGKANSAVFRLFCWGNSSNRDNWVYDIDPKTELRKAKYMIDAYNRLVSDNDDSFPDAIKWSRDLKRRFAQGRRSTFNKKLLVNAYWRPFSKVYLYADRNFNDVLTEHHFACFGPNLDRENHVMMVCVHPQIPFTVHAVNRLPDAGYSSRATQMFPRWLYSDDGTRIDNITDWAVTQFRKHYQPGRGKKKRPIDKESIFNYIYAVFHDPVYRKESTLNLKGLLPRVPLYGETEAIFWQWASWGEQLLGLHIGYEMVEPLPLERSDTSDAKARAVWQDPKSILRSEVDTGRIVIDSETTLGGLPREAWAFRLGNRCAIDWALEQYKEKKSRDTTIAQNFDTYRFADHKEQAIDLLSRVARVSVETASIIDKMSSATR